MYQEISLIHSIILDINYSSVSSLTAFLPGLCGVVIYEGKGDECDTLLYAETFIMTLGGVQTIDLTNLTAATATCRSAIRFYEILIHF